MADHLRCPACGWDSRSGGYHMAATPGCPGTSVLEPDNIDFTPMVDAMMGKTEVRTTSSTGGQKGVKPERYDLIPQGPLAALARLYAAGVLKYDAHQWREGYEYSKSVNALYRHMAAWLSGERYDVCPFHLKNESQAVQELEGGCAFNEKFPCVDGHRACYNHTGQLHLAAVAWHAFTLMEFEEKFPEHDDRYKGGV